MTRSRELIEKYEKIRKLQAKQDKLARSAVDQADELDEILAVSRRVHDAASDDGQPLAPSSRLMGPGGDTSRGGVDAEAAYSENLQRARLASPEAFSRTRSNGAATPATPPSKGKAKPHKGAKTPERKRAEAQAPRRSRLNTGPLLNEEEATQVMPRTGAPLLFEDDPTQPTGSPYSAKRAAERAARRTESSASRPSVPAATRPPAEAPPPMASGPSYDTLIAKFASDVEVKMGQGRENTYLRKRSEIEKRERTQTMVRPDKRK